jgi:selenocysteine lyase/cysteine desulfurase
VVLPHVTGRGFEDGTPNYLGIAAAAAGLDFIGEIGIERINAHVMRLTGVLLDGLKALVHTNGAPMVRIYGPPGLERRGGTVAFNVVDAEGELVDFRIVEQRANDASISIRTGFFCNPGAAEFAFDYHDEEAFRCISTMTAESFTLQQFSDCMGDQAVGAVRASLGIASNDADVARLCEVLATFRDADASLRLTPVAQLATID